MKVNVAPKTFTHEGAPSIQVNAYERLRRTVLACLLFENNFYEDGVEAVDRIKELCKQCNCSQILAIALDAAVKYKLRHVPLQLIVEALKLPNKPINFSDVICKIITRPDMMTDLLALYWGTCADSRSDKKT